MEVIQQFNITRTYPYFNFKNCIKIKFYLSQRFWIVLMCFLEFAFIRINIFIMSFGWKVYDFYLIFHIFHNAFYRFNESSSTFWWIKHSFYYSSDDNINMFINTNYLKDCYKFIKTTQLLSNRTYSYIKKKPTCK